MLEMAVLPNGEVVKLDRPALPTRDVLFKNPYKGEALLKVASTVRGTPTATLCNISGRRLADILSPSSLPYEAPEVAVYYRVFAREGGRLPPNGLRIELEPFDCEVVVLSRPGVVGLAEYLLPPYPILDGRPMVPGTLVEVR